MHIIGASGTEEAFAPVNLPHGAVVKEVTAHVYKNTGSNLFLNLCKVNQSTGVSTAMAVFNTLTNSTSIQTISDNTISSPTVDNENYRYIVRIGGMSSNSTNTRLYSVRIKYEVSVAD